MIEAAIFDMDGTLIDSEPMWKVAEKQVFSANGVGVSEELSIRTATMTTREVTEFWYRHFPWQGKSLEQVENEVIDRVASLIQKEGKPMEGVREILTLLHEKGIKIGLATNAPARLIPVVLRKLEISHYFHATASSEHEVSGKPHPAVYLTTAKKLGVDPSRCIAFEDSLSGIMAAKKANIKAVLIPPFSKFSDRKCEISHLKIRRLSEFNDSHLIRLQQQIT